MSFLGSTTLKAEPSPAPAPPPGPSPSMVLAIPCHRGWPEGFGHTPSIRYNIDGVWPKRSPPNAPPRQGIGASRGARSDVSELERTWRDVRQGHHTAGKRCAWSACLPRSTAGLLGPHRSARPVGSHTTIRSSKGTGKGCACVFPGSFRLLAGSGRQKEVTGSVGGCGSKGDAKAVHSPSWSVSLSHISSAQAMSLIRHSAPM